MEEITNNKLSTKGISIGLFYSFLIFIVSHFFNAFLSTIFVESLGGFSSISFYSGILALVVFVSPFLFLNTIAFFRSKNESHKRGFLIGYCLSFLYSIEFFLLYLIWS